MKNILRIWLPAISCCLFLAACGGSSGGGGLKNNDPGDNNPDTIAAFGDSLTNGSESPSAPYPARLTQHIGKSVYNLGVSGSLAIDNVGRVNEAINKYHPGIMLILYGVNDVIHSVAPSSAAAAVERMVEICKDNKVVPVLATYPLPTGHREFFAPPVRILNEHIRDIAKRHGIKCVNLEKEFGSNPDLFEEDGLHPNDHGTAIIALAFADLF